ncbi:MAG: 4-(cytidine 5'-diphospho)-2-C-methyl-D-erythritol kinase [Clostridia bacterium]|nr:4-(cytidine 5'-diphospho)-2-C-methyl-D-erythritol kinase [Clostridia bacterium]
MKKVTVEIPAKINLTLDITGVKNGYHELNSLVASINIYDVITVCARSDGKINLTMKGLPVDCPIIENNAYKAAKLFIDTFETFGVDITVMKNIPVAGGLGGSSADIAGVLNALNILYDINGDMSPLASDLGSDSTYMLNGGFAVLKGRGDEVDHIGADKKLYVLLITDNAVITSRNCYKKFDENKKMYKPCTAEATTAIYEGDVDKLFTLLKNDLTESASVFAPNVKYNLYNLKKAGAQTALLAGSGPTCYGLFKDKKERDCAYKKLVGLYGKDLIKAQTVVKDKDKFI